MKKSTTSVTGKASWLASEKYTAKRGGITVAAALVTADANGNKYLPGGTFLAPITSGANIGKYGVFDSGATDGRQTPDPNTSGFLLADGINLKDGDVICGLLIEGSVLGARVNPAGLNATIKTAVAGRVVIQ